MSELKEKIERAYREWQSGPHRHIPDDEDHLIPRHAFEAGWHARDKLILRLIADANEEQERADTSYARGIEDAAKVAEEWRAGRPASQSTLCNGIAKAIRSLHPIEGGGS